MAVASVFIDSIFAFTSVAARHRLTLVNVDWNRVKHVTSSSHFAHSCSVNLTFAKDTTESRLAVAGEAVDAVDAFSSVLARLARALVDVD